MTTLILANAWWGDGDVDLYFGLFGAAMGCLGGALGVLGGTGRLNPRSLVKIMVVITVACAVLLGVGIVAWLIDQPPHVWKKLMLFGAVGVGVCGGICVPQMLRMRRKAEERALDAKLLRNE